MWKGQIVSENTRRVNIRREKRTYTDQRSQDNEWYLAGDKTGTQRQNAEREHAANKCDLCRVRQ